MGGELHLAPAQRAAGGCSPLKATLGRGPAARRNFFGIFVIPIEKLMIFINILVFFQSDYTLFSVTHQGVLHVNQQIPTLNFTLNHESRLENVGFPILYA